MLLSDFPQSRLLRNLNKRKIPGLDGIRGLAALSVVGFHDQYFANHGAGLMLPGRLAVQVFFVMSGLLITWLMLRDEQENGTVDRIMFYFRRSIRLFPALFALLLWQYFTHLPDVTRGGILAAAFYCANYVEIFKNSAVMNGLGQTWSLAVEEHFYLIWPQIFLFVRNRRTLLNVCLGVMALQTAWRIVLGFQGKLVHAELASETASCAILAGCALALFLWQWPKRLPGIVLAPWLTPVSLFAIFFLAQMPRNAQLWWAVPLGIPFAAILILQAITYEWRVLENPVARYLGAISYSIYLWGMVAIEIVRRYGLDRGHVLVFPVVIALASASYFLVERPILSLGRQWQNKRRALKQRTAEELVEVA